MKRPLLMIINYGILVIQILVISSCQRLSQSIKDTFNTRPEERVWRAREERIKGFVTDEAELDSAESRLRRLPQYLSKSIKLYADIHFYDDGRIMTKLQHPENQDYVDAYTYEGGQWGKPVPVQLSVRDRISDRLVALDSVPFHTVAKVVENYNEKAASIEGASPIDHVYLIVHNGAANWYPNQIDGSREIWRIFFSLDGSVVSFLRN